MDRPDYLRLGSAGEDLAGSFLEDLGYEILGQNVRNHVGEIDLVAKHDGELVFIEVKTRRAAEIGHPAEFVDDRKQRKLAKTAALYLVEHDLDDVPCRFDVVCVTKQNHLPPKVEVIQSAFMVE